ncbi:MAG: hypothetical protein ACOYOK_14775 [Pseudobdellovibrionaceae bacterium]
MATQTNQLPPVAKTLYTHCKKCEAERYHVVLAHTSATAAKIECEVCGSKKSYNLPKKSSASNRSAMTALGKSTSAKAKGGPTKASVAKHAEEYQNLLQSMDAAESLTYSIRAQFAKNIKLQHPKFGLGVVLNTFPDKIDVIFQDEVRSLVHNRPA